MLEGIGTCEPGACGNVTSSHFKLVAGLCRHRVGRQIHPLSASIVQDPMICATSSKYPKGLGELPCFSNNNSWETVLKT